MSALLFIVFLFIIVACFATPANGGDETRKKAVFDAEKAQGYEPTFGALRCPRCGSGQISMGTRGFTITTGFIGSGKAKRVCTKCLHKF